MKYEYSIGGTPVHGVTDSLNEAEEELGVTDWEYFDFSPDGSVRYYWETEEEMTADKEGSYAHQIKEIPDTENNEDDEDDEADEDDEDDEEDDEEDD